MSMKYLPILRVTTALSENNNNNNHNYYYYYRIMIARRSKIKAFVHVEYNLAKCLHPYMQFKSFCKH